MAIEESPEQRRSGEVFRLDGSHDGLMLKQAQGYPPPAGGSSLDQRRWQQVLARDASSEFVYAVRTTGIFCRTTCPSRRPSQANVLFFPDAAAAQAAGFRACLRCQPASQPDQAAVVARITAYLQDHLDRAVPLAELSRVAGYAPAAVQRLFTRVLGVSPRAWANARRAASYRDLLSRTSATESATITDAVYAAGFSSVSRAHASAALGMQARRYRAQGAGEQIGYVIAEAPLPRENGAGTLGRVLVAATGRGVCAVLLGDEDAELRAELTGRFPRAELAEDPSLASHVAAVLSLVGEHPSAQSLPLDLRGTAFQVRVWEALRGIPRGQTRSYTQLAGEIGSPGAVRAVAAACGQNPAAVVVPCHRVIGSNGKLTGYRWGLERKQALLALEQETSG